MEWSNLKRGSLVELCFKGFDENFLAIVMQCFLDPLLYNGEFICEFWLVKEEDYVYISESELIYWKLLS